MKLILKCKFGSHLYGTDTPSSDTDYKGIFIADIKDIILKRDKKVIIKNSNNKNERNNKEDTDTEYKELREFIKDSIDGQTYALDMLFLPKRFIVKTSSTWEFIQRNRGKLLSKNIAPYIGYCRHQAGKYGLKGSRLGELKRVLELLKEYKGETIEDFAVSIKKSEFVFLCKSNNLNGGEDSFLNVIGKKYNYKTKPKIMLESLQESFKRYGERATLAQQNKGVDWKAMSHAFRCMIQLDELCETGEIKFPLKEAYFIKKIKLGQFEYDFISEELSKKMNKVINKVEKSKHLPSEPDVVFWDKFLIDKYLNETTF